MSPVEGIGGDLRSMTAGIARTLEAIVAADNTVEQIAGHAARSGFTGIGQGMARLRTAVRELHARVAALAESINTARARVARTPIRCHRKRSSRY
ncbi:hypothetical protein [Polymorphospora sp. NPDC050346]|uniref:hypothetical protein n=1 Tax=Polymorphospora sp. NPDC050346 TaxID=3155780 RepID=UPI0033E97F5D